MRKYLVTGGAGFIGSNIAGRLLKMGNFVKVADNFSTGKKANLSEFIRHPHFELLSGDLTDVNFARKAVKNMDFVLHQAAVASVVASIENPLHANNVNITATLNLLISAKDEGVEKFVYASSSSVYGDNPNPLKKESFPPNPISPYALTKYAGEKYAQLFWEIYKLPTVCLRYFNVFGPKQDPFSQYSAVIPKFINAFLEDKHPIIYGDGKQSRDFVYVNDVVDANLLASNSKKGNGEVFNIGCGKKINLNQLIALLQKITGNKIKPIYQKVRKGDILQSTADISRARNILHYNPKVTFEDGLIKTFEWYKNVKR